MIVIDRGHRAAQGIDHRIRLAVDIVGERRAAGEGIDEHGRAVYFVVDDRADIARGVRRRVPLAVGTIGERCAPALGIDQRDKLARGAVVDLGRDLAEGILRAGDLALVVIGNTKESWPLCFPRCCPDLLSPI